MITGLTKKFSLLLWQAKRRKELNRDLKDRLAVADCLADFKHYMRQNHKDYGQRSTGSRNRNGSDNRTQRKHSI
jgi:hypothetical protein